MNSLNIHYINELHKVYITEDEFCENESIRAAAIIYLCDRVKYFQSLN